MYTHFKIQYQILKILPYCDTLKFIHNCNKKNKLQFVDRQMEKYFPLKNFH